MPKYLLSSLRLAIAWLAGFQICNAADFRVVRDVSYLGHDRVEKLDLYVPDGLYKKGRLPAVVWIHGNAHDKGDAREVQFCETLAAAGFIGASINYGPWQGPLAGGTKSERENIQDAKNAVRFLRAHAADYQIDESRIGVGGASAGGYLALMVGFTTDQPRLEPAGPYPGTSSAVGVVIDLYGPFDFLADAKYKDNIRSLPETVANELRAIQPSTYVSARSPPVFIAHGREDLLVSCEHSLALDRALTEKGVAHELVLIPGVGHGFDLTNWYKQPLPSDLRPSVLVFLKKYLGDRAQRIP